LWNGLRKMLELDDRYRALDAKLRMFQDNLVLLVDLARQRQLNQDPVDSVVGVQLRHEAEERVLRGVGGQPRDPGVKSGVTARLLLHAHVGRRCGVVPHEDGRQPGHDAGGLGELEDAYVPATPAGVLRLLDEAGIELRGAEAVVVGRSAIVGKPTALLLLRRHATVTVCHSATRDLAFHTRRADVLVVAVGKPALVTKEMVKPGAAVIDVGTNRMPDRNGKRGKLVGDVDFEGVSQVAGWVTPVPGGVGPMTITMLLHNTLAAARRAAGRAPSPRALAGGDAV
jgi:methylenetetrahydrofolate dehydrogenase (NADP+)/methenyltetrahydrofolate cyclohydrolase